MAGRVPGHKRHPAMSTSKYKDSNGHWKKGHPGGPGAHPCGRRLMLQALDEALEDKAVRSKFTRDVKRLFRGESNVSSFQKLVMPLLPKEMILKSDESDGALTVSFGPAPTPRKIPARAKRRRRRKTR